MDKLSSHATVHIFLTYRTSVAGIKSVPCSRSGRVLGGDRLTPPRPPWLGDACGGVSEGKDILAGCLCDTKSSHDFLFVYAGIVFFCVFILSESGACWAGIFPPKSCGISWVF